jgi:hypothetical protein
MVKTTRQQREALVRVYRRAVNAQRIAMTAQVYRDFTYRAFRKTVQPGPGCIMVPFAGMWLGIEPDGYTHS